MTKPYPQLAALHRGLIVSCQAGPESPLHAPHFIAALAKSAELGGAAGFRVDGPENIAAVRAITDRPIVGIYKQSHPDSEVYITPTFLSASAVVAAGATLVALDATNRPRPEGEHLQDIINRLHAECDVPVMADVSTVEEGLRAIELGADLVATTMAGYTSYSSDRNGPAFEVLDALVRATTIPIVVEGRVWTVEDLRTCFDKGAYAVVIGSAITVPQLITQRFVAAIPPTDLQSSEATP